jgi:hypothetical protein
MPILNRRFTLLFPFLAAALACNALSGNLPPAPPPTVPGAAASAAATQAATGSTAAPSPTAEPPRPFSSLMANLKARVAAGEWTEEQGLVTTMKFVAGESSAADLTAPGKKIRSYEGSAVVRAAAAYLRNGSDAATKTELQRLITLIFPDPDRLDKYSTPAPAAAGGTGAVSARPRAQTTDCAALWAEGFPDGSTATCFQTRSITVAGKIYRLYVPANLPAGDARAALADVIMEAVQTAVNKFATFGPMPPANMVITELPGVDRHGAVDLDLLAATITLTRDAPCRMALFPSLVASGLNVAEVQQTIAHELFHCFQYQDYFEKMWVGQGIDDWWIEGTAEFFSNVAYPAVNYEYRWLPDFDWDSRDHSLVEIDYPDSLFFQYMENRGGDGSVLDLMGGMPASGGQAEQLQALARVRGMRDLFRDFAKAYMDHTIQDTGGGEVPVQPESGQPIVLDHSASIDKPIHDFVVERMLLRLPANNRALLHQVGAAGLAIDTRPTGTHGGWSPLPERLQGCSERNLLWVATSAAGDGGAQDYQIQAQVEHDDAACDPCLVGRWQLDNMSMWNAFETFIAATAQQLRPTLQSFDGQAIVEFTNDGQGTNGYEGFDLHYTQDIQRGGRTTHADAHIRIGGQGAFAWSTSDDHTALSIDAVYAEPTYDNSLIITENGLAIPVPVHLPPIQTPGSGQYVCTASTLQIISNALHQGILFNKLP